jgi:hypothetical protein
VVIEIGVIEMEGTRFKSDNFKLNVTGEGADTEVKGN